MEKYIDVSGVGNRSWSNFCSKSVNISNECLASLFLEEKFFVCIIIFLGCYFHNILPALQSP